MKEYKPLRIHRSYAFSGAWAWYCRDCRMGGWRSTPGGAGDTARKHWRCEHGGGCHVTAKPFRGVRLPEHWAAEDEYIRTNSKVATPESLARRRRIIERTGPDIYPLHLLDSGILARADGATRPGRWIPVGPPGSPRPIGWLESRAWYEWHYFRGVDPQSRREAIPTAIRAAVVERDWPWCQICGGLVALGEQHLDHIKPRSLGGRDVVANLRLAHDLCNIRRGAPVDG